MATLKKQLERSRAVSEGRLENAIFNYIRSIRDEVAKLNVDQLHVNSEDINGNPIGFYSRATELITGGRKSQGQPFDARDTGRFLDGWYIRVVNKEIHFDTRDKEKKKLILASEDWLSDKLFGLTDNNLRQLIRRKILPFVLTYSRKSLAI